MQTTNVCPLCRGTAIETYIEAPRAVLSSDSLGSSRTAISHGTILRCRSCGFGFLETRLAEEQLAELYRSLDHRVYEAEAEGRARTAEQHFKLIRQMLISGRLLDVGCASGTFLQICARNGFQVTGVEPAIEFANRARLALDGRGDVFSTTLQNAPLEPDSFDAITLWDVLEHVAEPVKFLLECCSFLRTGGYLLANVPDLGSVQAVMFGRKWPLLLPEHLNYFTRRSIALCAGKAGLSLIRFGRRSVFFSLGYILYRLGQHHVPGTGLAGSVTARLRLDRMTVPIRLGETYGIWQKS